jgi:hypothetical protein
MKKKGKRGRIATGAVVTPGTENREPNKAIDRWQIVLIAAMMALLVARPLVPEDPGNQNGYDAPFDVLWLVLACAWLLGQLRRGDLRLRFGWPDALLLALIAWHTLSALVAFYFGSPRPAVNALWDWIALGAMFVLARQLIVTAQLMRAVLVVILGLACGLSAIAIHQHFITLPNDIRLYNAAKDSTEMLYEQTGQWMPAGSSVRQQFENRLNSRLPTATFALSNSLAGFLVPWFVVLFAITLMCRRPSLTVAGIAAMLLLAACLYSTGSRSGGLAAIAGSLLFVGELARSKWLSWRRLAYSLGAVAAAVLISALIASATSVGCTAITAAARSMEFRIEYWQATLAMIRDNLMFGCGPGQFQDYYATYKLPQAAEVVQDPHNWLFEVWATAGTPAALLLLSVLAILLVRTARIADDVHDLAHSAIAATVVRNRTAPTSLDVIALGGMAGLALGAAIAWLTGLPVRPIHLILLIASLISVWLIWREWARGGALPPRLPLIAVVALLINLLAAGGINYPSIAASLWLLVAIQCNLADDAAVRVTDESITGPPPPRILQSPVTRWTAGLALSALVAAAIWTGYQPVMAARLQLSIADAALADGRADQSRSALEAALAADPWSADAATRLAAQRFADYQSLPTPSQRQSLLGADEGARRLAPHRSSIWAESAEHAAAIHRHTGSVEDVEAARALWNEAIALYPSRAELHAEAANFWRSIGDGARARAAATQSLEFDDLQGAAGHTDRLLDPTIRSQMESIRGSAGSKSR